MTPPFVSVKKFFWLFFLCSFVHAEQTRLEWFLEAVRNLQFDQAQSIINISTRNFDPELKILNGLNDLNPNAFYEAFKNASLDPETVRLLLSHASKNGYKGLLIIARKTPMGDCFLRACMLSAAFDLKKYLPANVEIPLPRVGFLLPYEALFGAWNRFSKIEWRDASFQNVAVAHFNELYISFELFKNRNWESLSARLNSGYPTGVPVGVESHVMGLSTYKGLGAFGNRGISVRGIEKINPKSGIAFMPFRRNLESSDLKTWANDDPKQICLDDLLNADRICYQHSKKLQFKRGNCSLTWVKMIFEAQLIFAKSAQVGLSGAQFNSTHIESKGVLTSAKETYKDFSLFFRVETLINYVNGIDFLCHAPHLTDHYIDAAFSNILAFMNKQHFKRRGYYNTLAKQDNVLDYLLSGLGETPAAQYLRNKVIAAR
jgi:hypothetical protein